jgi:hypothetical protein
MQVVWGGTAACTVDVQTKAQNGGFAGFCPCDRAGNSSNASGANVLGAVTFPLIKLDCLEVLTFERHDPGNNTKKTQAFVVNRGPWVREGPDECYEQF